MKCALCPSLTRAPEDQARAAADAVARDAYGRLLAILARRTGHLADAEDALAGAFTKALQTWSQTGVPDNPQAWLLAVARRSLIDAARRSKTRQTHEGEVIARIEALAAENSDRTLPDERLSLMLVCAHPDIDPALHTPLMLQAVLGLDAARIASAFLIKPATMGQRLSRAKARIREAGLGFEPPEARTLPARLQPVLDAIYAAYGTGWEAFGEDGGGAKGLAEEARFLAELTATLCPDSAEAQALAALIAYCEARRPARRSAEGVFIALCDQDTRALGRRSYRPSRKPAAPCDEPVCAQGATVWKPLCNRSTPSAASPARPTGAPPRRYMMLWLALVRPASAQKSLALAPMVKPLGPRLHSFCCSPCRGVDKAISLGGRRWRTGAPRQAR